MGMHLQWTGKPKVQHPTREDAETHRLELQARSKRPINVYPCGNHWHVGHDAKTSSLKGYLRPAAAVEERLVGRLIPIIRNLVQR